MNQKVQELGLKNSHFANPHGLDDPNHYTSARDMAQITRWAIGVDGFRELFGCVEYEMNATNKKDRNYPFINQDAMLHDVNKVYYQGIEGGKLGYTDNARHTIVTLAKRGDMELICVCLGSGVNTKYSDTAALLDYCFDHYSVLTLPAKNVKDFVVPISDGTNRVGQVDIRAREDVTLIVEKGATLRNIKYEYKIPEHYMEGEEIAPSLELYSKSGELLATLPLDYTVGKAAQIPMAQVVKEREQAKTNTLLLAIAKWVLIGLAGATVLLFLARFCIKTYYQQKRKRLRAARGNQGRGDRNGGPQKALRKAPERPPMPLPKEGKRAQE